MRLASAISIAVIPLGVAYLVSRAFDPPDDPFWPLAFAVEVAVFVLAAVSARLLTRVRLRPAPRGPVEGTLDIFIPTCGEPLGLLEEVVTAALAVRRPHRTIVLNDWHVAGLTGSEQVEALARRLGAECFTRTSGPRMKAANLNFGLTHSTADFLLAVDADNVLDAGAADETLGYFADPDVGFVSTPQAFVVDGPDIFNSRETLVHSSVQRCSDADDIAMSMGNGALYRRRAIDAVGGFDETAGVEDVAVSADLHAAGWKSVHHIAPIAVGTVPPTGAAFMRQRLRWAEGTIQAIVARRMWKAPRLNRRQRLHYVQAVGAYFAAASSLPLLVYPTLGILGVGSVEFELPVVSLVLLATYVAGLLALVLVLGGPAAAYRLMSQSVYLSFTNLVAVIRAIRGRFGFTVTAKPGQRARSWLTIPPIVFFVGMVVALGRAAFVPGAPPFFVAVDLALAWMLAAPITAVSLDWRRNRVARVAVRTAIAVGVALWLVA